MPVKILPPNPDRNPDTAFITVSDGQLKAEQILIDKYQAFSAELLRLSLLGIAVIGFVYKKEIYDKLPPSSKHQVGLSVIFFGVAAVFAIIHRYFSSETLRYFIWGLRFHQKDKIAESKKCLDARYQTLFICILSKAASAICLGLGAFLLSVAFMLPLLNN